VFETLSLRWVFSTSTKKEDDNTDIWTQESWHRQRTSHYSESGQLGVEVPITWLSYEAWLQFWAALGNLAAMMGLRRIGFQQFKERLRRHSTFARIAEHYY